MGVYSRILGSAWIYDRLRPWLLGGFNFDEVYSWLDIQSSDVVVDVGCGTGYALEFIEDFHSYHGFDIDEAALSTHSSKYSKKNVSLYPKALDYADVLRIRPTKCVAMGLLHHLSDEEVTGLLRTLSAGGSVRRIITLDIVIREGHLINNILARLDRGRFARTELSYNALISPSPFCLKFNKFIDCGNKMATYYATCLVPTNPK